MPKRVGFHSHYFRGTPLESQLGDIAQCIHDAGGNAMECLPSEIFCLDQDQQQRLRERLEQLDVEVIIGAGRSLQTDPSSADPDIQKAAMDLALAMLPKLHAMGCHKWDGMIHSCWPVHPDGILRKSEKEAALQRSADHVRQLMDLADQYDIDFCFEVVNRFEHPLFNTSEEGVAYCELIGHPRAKVLLDTFHMNIDEHSITQAIVHAAQHNRLGHFHVGEANRSVPGTRPSHMDWDGIFQTLKDCDYQGTIILEPFMLPETPSAASVCLWRDLTDGADLETYYSWVKTGIDFVRAHWE